MPRTEVAALLSYIAANDFPGVETQTPEQARAAYVALVPATDVPVGPIAVARPVTIPTRAGHIDGLLLDSRADREPGPVVVWYHGGGFVTGGIATHRGFGAYIARALDLPVLLVDYRLAPESPFPAAVEDSEDAARWVAGSYSGLVLGGDSAGGTLTISTAMALRDSPAAVPVVAHMVIYPATDLTRTYPSQLEFAAGRVLTSAGRDWYYRHYAPVVDSVLASPLLGDVSGLPPAVVLTAEEDPVRDEGRAYAAALVAAGVPSVFLEAAGHVHGFVVLRQVVPSTQDDLDLAFDALSVLIRRPR